MSRVVSKFKVGDHVVWSDQSVNGLTDMIFSGIVFEVGPFGINTKVEKVHLIESSVGIDMGVLRQFEQANTYATITDLTKMRKWEDFKYIK